jgi:dipeptidase E
MRLLLTSAGITNKSIAAVLKNWVNKIRFAFIPTAANIGSSNKDWLIRDLSNCSKLGPVDIVDISAVDKKNWLARLKKANVIVVGGGDTAYLMKCICSSGLDKELPNLLKKRVYMGISAGSIAAAKNIAASSDFLSRKELKNAPAGLAFVEFNLRSHYNSPNFSKAQDVYLKKITPFVKGDLYALDDESAVVFDNGKVSVVSEGKWKLFKGC